MGYKISKSRKGDGLIWIAREHGKKGVVAVSYTHLTLPTKA